MNYWLHPAAQTDLREAAEFYRGRAGVTLSQAFLAEFEHSAELVLRHPELGALWRHGRRRVLLRRFPYSLIYAIADDQIRILAVANQYRRAGYWRSRK